jgi:hypothetical protein
MEGTPMIRRALLAAVLATTAVTVVTTSPAQARACSLDYVCYTTYYSDNTYTTAVGGKFVNCDGAGSSWGTVTVYKDFVETPC